MKDEFKFLLLLIEYVNLFNGPGGLARLCLENAFKLSIEKNRFMGIPAKVPNELRKDFINGLLILAHSDPNYQMVLDESTDMASFCKLCLTSGGAMELYQSDKKSYRSERHQQLMEKKWMNMMWIVVIALFTAFMLDKYKDVTLFNQSINEQSRENKKFENTQYNRKKIAEAEGVLAQQLSLARSNSDWSTLNKLLEINPSSIRKSDVPYLWDEVLDLYYRINPELNPEPRKYREIESHFPLLNQRSNSRSQVDDANDRFRQYSDACNDSISFSIRHDSFDIDDALEYCINEMLKNYDKTGSHMSSDRIITTYLKNFQRSSERNTKELSYTDNRPAKTRSTRSSRSNNSPSAIPSSYRRTRGGTKKSSKSS